MQRVEDVVIKAIMATTPPVAAACKMFVPHRSNCFGKVPILFYPLNVFVPIRFSPLI